MTEHHDGEATPGSAGGPLSYDDRKQRQRCTYPSCTADPAPGVQLCPKHRRRKAAAQRRWQKKRRAARREAPTPKCIRCGEPSETYRCPACVILEGRHIPTAGTDHGEDKSDPERWRADPDGYARFRGLGKRGPRTKADVDEQDLIDALNGLVSGRTGLTYARSPDVQELGRVQRRAAIDAALGQLELAARFIAEVVQRNQRSGKV